MDVPSPTILATITEMIDRGAGKTSWRIEKMAWYTFLPGVLQGPPSRQAWEILDVEKVDGRVR